jgi:hypothetical protein
VRVKAGSAAKTADPARMCTRATAGSAWKLSPRLRAFGMRAVIGPAAPPGDDQAVQQPSYGAQLDSPPAAMALLNTWFCSATLAWPKSAGLPPYAAQVEALNW